MRCAAMGCGNYTGEFALGQPQEQAAIVFFDSCNFAFIPALEAQWRSVRDELLALPHSKFEPWKETYLYEAGWDVFGLYAFGKRVEENCRLAPRTAAIVEAVPGLITAGFSSLQPGTHIQPHVGYQYDYSEDGELTTRRELNTRVLRMHLGLIVPETFTPIGCAMRVGEELRNWEEGKCLVFDDTIQHEAWNRATTTRVVLLLDFLRPPDEAARQHVRV